MLILGLDTCLSSCSVAVLDGERVLASAREVMARGHQERLAPMAQAVMAEAGLAFDRLDRIAVTVGPGSFTGLRVGIAFAKGLALALEQHFRPAKVGLPLARLADFVWPQLTGAEDSIADRDDVLILSQERVLPVPRPVQSRVGHGRGSAWRRRHRPAVQSWGLAAPYHDRQGLGW